MSIMRDDCRFDVDSSRFQLRVGAIIIEEGYVLLAKTNLADYYYSVGGAVKLGETAQQAVEREVLEETGLPYSADRLVFVHENFFVDNVICEDRMFHEVCLYFLMKPMGKKQEVYINSNASIGREFMHWIPLEKLSEIKVFPVFYPEKLMNLPDTIQHIITNEC